ncbi:MAG: hypothetical protein M0Q91_14750, partial [Methanoregula sp.]|nr:hypothetical protein [Methanoregula sp.]
MSERVIMTGNFVSVIQIFKITLKCRSGRSDIQSDHCGRGLAGPGNGGMPIAGPGQTCRILMVRERQSNSSRIDAKSALSRCVGWILACLT